MTIIQRSTPFRNPLSLLGAGSSPIDAQRGLAGLWIPSAAQSGRLLPNLAGQAPHLLVSGTWQNTRGGIAFNRIAAASFPWPFFPVAGGERPFSIWCRVHRTTTSDSEVLRQYVTSEADRMILSFGGADRVRYSHQGDLYTATIAPPDCLLTIGVSEQPGRPILLYVDGRLAATGASSTGRCSPASTQLGASNAYDLLGLAIWLGRALSPQDHAALHRNPNLFQQPEEAPPVPAGLALPIGAEETYHRRIDWPNRPWWRRWSFRKRNY